MNLHKNKIIKIMLVDDSALMRNAISYILDTQKDFEIVERAANGREALDKLRLLPQAQHPDVILTDLEMPIMDGLTFIKHSRLKNPAKIIILSSKTLNPHSPEAKTALQAGAAAIISKPSGSVSLDIEAKRSHEIIRAIRSVIK